jgi:hypothetical protein
MLVEDPRRGAMGIAQATIKRLVMQRLWDHGMRDARHATAGYKAGSGSPTI